MSTHFHHLADDLTVSVDGVLDLDDDVSERAAARVVVTMPDYVADGLAHVLADAVRVADVFGGFRSNGLDAAALAEALYAAASSGDYRCPREACRCRWGLLARTEPSPVQWRAGSPDSGCCRAAM